jgi:SM-20-related protein
MHVPLALNPALDAQSLAAAYAWRQRFHIRDVLTAQSASRLHTCLERETPFSLVVNSVDKVFDLPPDQLAKMTEANWRALTAAINQNARRGFQFVYENHRMSAEGEAYPIASHGLADAVAFLNSEAFLDFVRRVTGLSKIRFADAQATRYSPGHFLTQHDDNVDGMNRLAAFVLNLTPAWRPDWGGALLFLDQTGNVEEGYAPAFNALNLFTVPQAHLVSQVSTFAGAPRYAITGWFRS